MIRRGCLGSVSIAARMRAYVAVGFRTFLVELPAPYDAETMELLTQVVKPMVESEAGQDAGREPDARTR